MQSSCVMSEVFRLLSSITPRSHRQQMSSDPSGPFSTATAVTVGVTRNTTSLCEILSCEHPHAIKLPLVCIWANPPPSLAADVLYGWPLNGSAHIFAQYTTNILKIFLEINYGITKVAAQYIQHSALNCYTPAFVYGLPLFWHRKAAPITSGYLIQ